MTSLDKAKYLEILRTQGLSAAISVLHADKNALEVETFEGTEGYRPELFEEVQKYAEFSRELWNLTTTASESASS